MTYEQAMDRVRDQMAGAKNGQERTLGEGVTALLRLHPEWAEQIGDDKKTLKGALSQVRQGATQGVSDPVATTQSVCRYYGLPVGGEANARALAIAVQLEMMGGAPGAPEAAGVEAPKAARADAEPAARPAEDGFDDLLEGLI